jgi:hypothetical protein
MKATVIYFFLDLSWVTLVPICVKSPGVIVKVRCLIPLSSDKKETNFNNSLLVFDVLGISTTFKYSTQKHFYPIRSIQCDHIFYNYSIILSP